MFLQILEAFAADDSTFVQNCGRLMAMSSAMVTMPHYEFRNICDTKLESIDQRITRYHEVPAPRGVSARDSAVSVNVRRQPCCLWTVCPCRPHAQAGSGGPEGPVASAAQAEASSGQPCRSPALARPTWSRLGAAQLELSS